jgi:SAM-dependent methyltransferase
MDMGFEFEPLQHASNYRKALIEEFGPYLKGRVIEVGAGIGQVTELIAKCDGVREVLAVEPESQFCRELAHRLPTQTVICGTVELLPPETSGEAIVCVNVLEHIPDDEDELGRYRRLLAKEKGTLCLFVPARSEIYSPIDRDFGHYRRYNKPELRWKLESAGFEIIRTSYYNSLGYFVWWLNFCILQKREFQPGPVKFYDRIVFPMVHWVESRICRPPFGQSLISIARAR